MIVDTLHLNNGKLTPALIEDIASQSEVIYLQPTANTRICLLKLPTGHELVGVSQVLNASNDVATIGNSIAFENAKDQVWQLCGTIAKLYT